MDALAAEATAAAADARLAKHPSPSMASARLHFIPPSMPLLDARDARQRAGNYRSSRRVCADGWCHYFEVLSLEIERAQA